MAARIFISYRTSDGKDKATALARDLGTTFGDDQVFIDKDDLRGGSEWCAEIREALAHRPILLLLVTPQLFDERDQRGALRIADPSDPVRRELIEALAGDAVVIPLLCDGVDALPDRSQLPAPFDRLDERTWRKLRAYDWNADVSRLIGDLRAAGVVPHAESSTPSIRRAPTPRRRAWLASVTAVGIAAFGLVLYVSRFGASGFGDDPMANVTGAWRATVADAAPFSLVIERSGDGLGVVSAPIRIVDRAEWSSYRRFWREQTGTDLDEVVLRGKGTWRRDPETPISIDIAVQTHARSNDSMVDSGNLSARLDAGGRSLVGQLWSNGDQAAKPIRLERR